MGKTTTEYVFENLPLPFYVISITLHGIGIFLLRSLRTRKNQDSIILNLSVAETIMSCCELTQNVLQRFYPVSSDPVSYLTIAQCTLFVLPSFLIMTVLTLDRFFETYLNLKYVCYFNKNTTRYFLSACWLSGFVCASVLLTLRYRNVNTATVIFKYIFPVTEGIFLMTAIVSYSYIYTKFRKVHHQPCHSRLEFYGHQARTKYRMRRNFFPPFLIVLSFVLFVILPDITNLMLFYVFNVGTTLHSNILLTFYVLGFICDAVIYIFLQNHIRRQFYKMFRAKTAPDMVTPTSSARSSLRSTLYNRTKVDNGVPKKSRKRRTLGLQNETFVCYLDEE